MEWHGDEYLASVRQRLAGNLGRAATVVADAMRQSVAEPYPPASSPGDPPARRTGDLQAAITSVVDEDGLTARAGAAGSVAYWLETGTARMAARPFALPALVNNVDSIRNAVVDGIGRPTE